MSLSGLSSLLNALNDKEEEYCASLREDQIRCPDKNDHAHALYHGDPRKGNAILIAEKAILRVNAHGSRSSAMSLLIPIESNNLYGLEVGEVKKIGGNKITDKNDVVLDLHLKRVPNLEEGEDYENNAFLPLKNINNADRAEGKARGGLRDVSLTLYQEGNPTSIVVVDVAPKLASKLTGRDTKLLDNMQENVHRSIKTQNGHALTARLSQQSDGKSRVVQPSKLAFPKRYLPPHLFKAKYSNSNLEAEHEKWIKKETESSVSKKRKRRG